MAVSFKIPKGPEKSILTIDEFLGVDFSNSPANIDENKSPSAVNMIRDVPQKVRKRMGYEVISRYDNLLINGASTSGIFTVNADKSVKIDASSITNVIYDEEGNPISPVNSITLMSSLELKAEEKYLISVGKDYEIGEHSRVKLILLNDGVEIEEFDNGEYIPDEDVTVAVRLTFIGGIDEVDVYPQIFKGGKMPDVYINGFSGSHKVNGYHYRRGDDDALLHIGENIFIGSTLAYTGANDNVSKSWQFNDNLYIIDGKKMLLYDGEQVQPVENVAYVPTITIAKSPSGGGQQYENINLLSAAFIETFLGEAGVKNYQLTFGDLDATAVEAQVMNAQGEWVDKVEGTDFSVDRTNGIVSFIQAPGESPLTGEDNVKIKAYRTVEGYADRINHCRFGTRFGVNGAFDRLFISGNPDFLNADWYSEQWDCTYFPDMGYSLLGSSKSAIVGYSIISNYLATHKDEQEMDLSIILREGDMVDNEPSFKIINALQGAGAIASNSFGYLCTEPLFLTRSGLYAVTAQDITGEKYAQSRSFFLNGKLTNENFEDLQKSFAIIFNDMYLLSVADERLYILDGLQPIRTDKSEPYATRQYVGFFCDNLPIHYMWEKENRLYFGTTDGRLCRFFKDKEAMASYSDDGEPIYCQWETPDIDGKLFYKNKSLRYLAIRVGAAIATSVSIYAMDRGLWKFVKKDTSFGRYFSFQHLIFSKVAFSGNKTQKISRTKIRVKKVDKYRIRLVNDENEEPFALYNIAMEYVENGNYKG